MPRHAPAGTLVPIALLLIGGAASSAVAQDRTQQVDVQFEEALPIMQSRGFSPRQRRRYGSLGHGASERIAVSVEPGSMLVVGLCDNDCSNLDLVLLDSGGSTVDSDVLDDDYPLVTAPRAGSYTVEVRMTACAAASCRYGVQLFSR